MRLFLISEYPLSSYIYRRSGLVVKAFASQAEGTRFNPGRDRPNTDSNLSFAKRQTFEVRVAGRSDGTLKPDAPYHSRCGTKKNPHCSMAVSSEHRPKFQALHRHVSI